MSNLIENEVDNTSVECYITYEDPRYQVLVLQGSFGSIGYIITLDTGELQRTCICAAYSSSECCCGYVDKYELIHKSYCYDY